MGHQESKRRTVNDPGEAKPSIARGDHTNERDVIGA